MDWNKIILSTIKGQPTGCLPFIPRLDLWYKSNKRKNSLPDKYKNCSLKEITNDLGAGYHSVVPDFRDFIDKKSSGLIPLGIYDLNTNPYKINLESIDFECETKDGLTTTVINTPFGKIEAKYLYNNRMEEAGNTIGHTIEHPIKSEKDLKAVGYIFENIGVLDNYEGFKKFKEFVGKEGMAVGFSMLAASPVHHIMKELMNFEKFVYLFEDNLGVIEKLASKIEVLYEKILNIVIDSQAKLIFLGANYDSFLTWPPFFKKYITPYLKKWSAIIHKNNKFILTHADGENNGLLGEYLDSDIDIADSICPSPMTSLSLKQVRNVFKDEITIWGGIPSVCLLKEAMNDYNFEKQMEKIMADIGDGSRIILSFADTTPPQAEFSRIEKVAKIARNFNSR